MKILLLLSGYTCKRIPWGDGDKGTPLPNQMEEFWDANKYLKKLLKNNHVRTICTLWDNLGIEEVKKAYKPKICLSLNQDDFQKELSKDFKDYEKERIRKRNKWLQNNNAKNDLVVSSERYASQLFCRQIVCKKGIEYIESSSYEPELIILTRYDIGTRGGIFVRNPSLISNSIKDFLLKDNKNPRIVLPSFNQLNLGLPDMWFYLNKRGLYSMNNIFDEYVHSIKSHDNSYKDYLTNGWPSSEYFNYCDIGDKRQFTNVVLSKKKQVKLMRYEDWELPNIHAFLKYYLSLRKVKFKIKYISYTNSLLSMLLFANNIRSLKSVLYEIYAYTIIKLKSILKIY